MISKMISRATALTLAMAGFAYLASAADPAYSVSVEKWRQDYESNLKSDGGWLTVSGLFWLHEGENHFGSDPLNDIVLPAESAPPDAGYFEYHAGKTVVHVKSGVPLTLNGRQVESVELRPDSPSDKLALGDLSLFVHASGDRYAIRLRDKNSKLRKNFTGSEWYSVDDSFRVNARYTAYEQPKQIEIQNVLGDSEKPLISGYVTFSIHGQQQRLEASKDQAGHLSFVFRDLTSGKETYPSARFLRTDVPENGNVVLDFNEAYNPPCAYNPYTTCPLPPPANRLRVEIAAGEKTYKHAHSE